MRDNSACPFDVHPFHIAQQTIQLWPDSSLGMPQRHLYMCRRTAESFRHSGSPLIYRGITGHKPYEPSVYVQDLIRDG
jgi:hypothetical protein